MMAKLTLKQKKFADLYMKTGNAELAAKEAGYSARGNTTKILQSTTIGNYIKERNEKLDKKTIADMQEIKEYWTNILRKDAKGEKGGLKASEYIAKTNAAFIDRVDVDAVVKITIEGDVKDWAK